MPDFIQQLVRNARTRANADAQRDRLIVEARRAGHTWRSIAEAAGLTEQGTVNAARKYAGGELPVPDQPR